jgi:hypothetical protein
MAQCDDRKPNSEQILTTRQGHPVTSNQSQRTVGSRGLVTLENYHFLFFCGGMTGAMPCAFVCSIIPLLS